jgi:hypothetical protein
MVSQEKHNSKSGGLRLPILRPTIVSGHTKVGLVDITLK